MPDACARVEPMLSAWVDGELAASRAGRLARHVRGCPGCTRALDDAVVARRLLRNLPVRGLPADVRQSLAVTWTPAGPVPPLPVARLAAGAARGKPPPGARRLPRASAAFAILAGLVAGAAFSFATRSPPQAPRVPVPVDVFVADHLLYGLGGAPEPVTADAGP